MGNSVVGIALENVDPSYLGATDTIANISNVSISGGTVGIRVGNSLADSGSLTGNVTLNLTGGSITGTDTGILVEDGANVGHYEADLLISGTTISGGTTGLTIDGPEATIVGNTLHSMTFSGQSGDYITLADGDSFLDKR